MVIVSQQKLNLNNLFGFYKTGLKLEVKLKVITVITITSVIDDIGAIYWLYTK